MKPTINLNRPLPPLHLLTGYLLAHPRLSLTVAFSSLYLLTIAWYYPLSSHDPTSILFSTEHGYDKSYSTIREAQALSFINETNTLAINNPTHTTPPPTSPSLCLGVATVARPTTQYITLTIGSLLEGLTPAERAQIHFIFFIAHSDPTTHPVYHEPWTSLLPDTSLTYASLPRSQLSLLREWESAHDYRAKGLFDYTHLLSTCYTHTSAPYIALLEGDVLAARGWFARALAAAEHIDSLDLYDEGHAFHGSTKPPDPYPPLPASSWLYLRLFHTEAYLGWNAEFWPSYVSTSALLFVLLGAALVGLRAAFRRALARPLANPTLALVCCLFLPLAIALFFALGRATVLPLPRPPPAGVQRMDQFGCCSQGFVFPRRLVPFLQKRIGEKPAEYIDMLMEAVAGAWGMERWAVSPSLLQHVGGTSSKGDIVADERARRIWSFGFERLGRGGFGGA